MTRQRLIEMLKNQAVMKKRPDGSPYPALSFRSEETLAAESKYSHHEIQAAALEQGIVPERYSRNQKSLSSEDQLKLLGSSVIIVGLGGLGGAVTEILARVGVGKLTLVDGDVFEDSNLNRQLLATTKDLGRQKAVVARERVQAINPGVIVQTFPQFLIEENCLELIGEALLAVDCLDNIPDRFVLQSGCRRKIIPLVSAAIGGESGQATIIFPDDTGLSLIYGREQDAPRRGVEKSLGTLPYTAVTMAAIECAEVISYLTGRPPVLRNRLLLTDLSEYSIEHLSFS